MTDPSIIADKGGSFIPASQRPDGSWRKPRRVKDGYVPQEEVPLYESKGKQWAKSKPTYPVGYCPTPVATASTESSTVHTSIPGLFVKPGDEGNKSKKKKKKKTVAVDASVKQVAEVLQKTRITEASNSTSATADGTQQDASSDLAKKLKNLKRRLREIEQLEQKISSGELKNPEKNQLEKVKRKEELIQQISDLEDELET